MASSLPKVLVPVCGRPMLLHILDRVQEAQPECRVGIIVGYQKENVIEAVRSQKYSMKIEFVEQNEQKGTGHAVQCAMQAPWGAKAVQNKENVLVLPGDLPLLTSELVREMSEPLKRGSALRLLTAILHDPFGYGRVVRRGKKGPVQRIVEEKDAKPREKLITEVGLSIYTFNAAFLSSGVSALKNNNAQKEYYLTDLVQAAFQKKRTIETRSWENPEDVRGVNNPYELSMAAKTLNQRVVRRHALNGVRFQCLEATWVEPTVEVAPDVTIYPGVILEGSTRVSSGAILGPNVMLRNVKVGTGAEIKAGTVAEDSEIGAGCKVGPYAHLRPQSRIGTESKIGNFVELKNTQIADHTSVAHLSYLGDATVGSRVNIGCGFVTCNFDGRVIDGRRKHPTIIEDDVFVGSDCQTVAPVQLGRGSYVASGSTITENVEPESLAIARARQVSKPGYAKKLKGQSSD